MLTQAIEQSGRQLTEEEEEEEEEEEGEPEDRHCGGLGEI